MLAKASRAEAAMSEQMIPPEQARALLDEAMRQRLGDDWQDDEDGWLLVTGHDYMARVTKGRVNIDFYVDLLGNVTVEEKPIGPGQESGRILAWMILGLSLAIALLIARIVGWL
jgi:hypothetical protein